MELYLDKLTLPGNLPRGENPQPVFRDRSPDLSCVRDTSLLPEETTGYGVGCGKRVLPYRMQDRYIRSEDPVTLKTVILENEFLRAVFLPEYGGKLWSLFSKEEDRELLFQNPVFRPANLGVRNAWTAGGIEWNLGHTGHHVFTCSDLYCARVLAEDGETFLRMYEYEAAHMQVLQMDFHLPPGSRQLWLHVRIENGGPDAAPLYWWTNTALKLTSGTRVFSGTSRILYQLDSSWNGGQPGFGGCDMPAQPNLNCTDLSYPWKIPHSAEYFFQNSKTAPGPWEAGLEADGTGFFERSTQPLFARKLFCWGMGSGGRHWCDYLSRPGEGDYVEIQAGLAPTQLHTTTLDVGGILEFTQAFGAIRTSADTVRGPFAEAMPRVEQWAEQILPCAEVTRRHTEYAGKSCCKSAKMLHLGSAYGGLEQARRQTAREAPMAPHLDFPLPSEDGPFGLWLHVLRGGHPGDAMPVPYLTDIRWLKMLKHSVSAQRDNKTLSFLYAVSLAENGMEDEARVILGSLAEQNDPWALHALGTLDGRDGKEEQAAALLLAAYHAEGGRLDVSFSQDALSGLIETKQWNEAWALYQSIPAHLLTEGEQLTAAWAAVKLEYWDFLEHTFSREYASIREGASGLEDIWYEYQARRLAREQGVPFSSSLIDRSIPLPRHIDFRMFV